jgi:hypothetical protein
MGIVLAATCWAASAQQRCYPKGEMAKGSHAAQRVWCSYCGDCARLLSLCAQLLSLSLTLARLLSLVLSLFSLSLAL